LLDAFRNDYLSNKTTPFLARSASEGEHYQRVVQSLGFCERTEILTGLTSAETGFFTAIGYDPENSCYAGARGLGLLHALERVLVPLLRPFGSYFASRVHARLRGRVNVHFRRRGAKMGTYMIPFSLLENFALTEDLRDHRERDVFSKPSILDQLTAAGRRYDYDSFTALGGRFPHHTDQQRLDAVPPKVAEDAADLYLVYVGLPDSAGHKFGPGSEGLRSALHDLDSRLERFANDILKSGEHRFVFLGDHGMVNVEQKVDVGAELERCLGERGLKLRRDYIYFLDSTMARVWAIRDGAREPIAEALTNSTLLQEHGSFLDENMARRFHTPWGDPRYGDHLWLADPGVLVFPDFFHRLEPDKAMHGYDPSIPESQGTCIHWGHDIAQKVVPEIPLTGVHDILARSLEL
jgi:predicted AlkP superfamily pyrophosphatase or phosphodiesterase